VRQIQVFQFKSRQTTLALSRKPSRPVSLASEISINDVLDRLDGDLVVTHVQAKIMGLGYNLKALDYDLKACVSYHAT